MIIFRKWNGSLLVFYRRWTRGLLYLDLLESEWERERDLRTSKILYPTASFNRTSSISRPASLIKSKIYRIHWTASMIRIFPHNIFNGERSFRIKTNFQSKQFSLLDQASMPTRVCTRSDLKETLSLSLSEKFSVRTGEINRQIIGTSHQMKSESLHQSENC